MNVSQTNKMLNNFRQNKDKTGFTLIEIMVAVSIFVIVAFIVTSTLLAILDAGRRANQIRLIVDNMNFALDSMTYKMKFGSDYYSDGETMSFIDRDSYPVSYCLGKHEESENNSILKCQGEKNGSAPICPNDSSCEPIITEEVNVTELVFKESKCAISLRSDDICSNKAYVILVKAQIEYKNSPMDLEFQTAVSQSQSQSTSQ